MTGRTNQIDQWTREGLPSAQFSHPLPLTHCLRSLFAFLDEEINFRAKKVKEGNLIVFWLRGDLTINVEW